MNDLFNRQRDPYSNPYSNPYSRPEDKDLDENHIVTKKIIYNRHGQIRKVIEYEIPDISKPTREKKP